MAKEVKNKKSISDVLSELNKKYGAGTVTTLNSNEKSHVKTLSTGSISIDRALGGGYAVGRIVEIFSEASCGKSSISLHAVAEAQKKGLKCAYIDTEHAMDKNYAEVLGVDLDELIFTQPDSAEEALTILIGLIDTGEFSLIIVDSVASMVPEKIFEAEVGEATMALLARILSTEMPKIVSKCSQNDCTVVFVNQVRTQLGGYGSGVSTPGGKAIPFYASQRIQLFKGSAASEGGEVVANNSWCRVIKNKVAPPMREAKYTIVFGKGLDKLSEIIEFAVEFGIINKAGSWYSYGDVKLGQGASAVKDILLDNPELLEEIETKVRNGL